jgi:carboxypeptidase D
MLEMRASSRQLVVIFLLAVALVLLLGASVWTSPPELVLPSVPGRVSQHEAAERGEWPPAHCDLEDGQSSVIVEVVQQPTYEVSKNPDAFIDRIHERFPKLTHVYELGKSVEGRPLKVLVISDNPRQHEIGEPEVKLIASLHGNELVGVELLASLVLLLLENYCRDPEISHLLDSTRVHVLLSANPDGRQKFLQAAGKAIDDHVRTAVVEESGRENAHHADLNRDFIFDGDFQNLEKFQLETQHLLKWMQQYPFVLSMVYHGGTKLVVYPFDETKKDVADLRTFQYIAEHYIETNPGMRGGYPCPVEYPKEHFKGGHIAGAKWYALKGGMQDVNYLYAQCLEFTIEVSCLKVPPARDLPAHWADNKRSLLNLLHMAHIGFKGRVFHADTKRPLTSCVISVSGIDHDTKCSSDGEYWRLIAPGQYTVTLSAHGFSSTVHTIQVSEDVSVIDFSLHPVE